MPERAVRHNQQVSVFGKRGSDAPQSGAFAVFEENTVYDEINGIAKEIARLVATDGLRYRDIAVVSCNDSHAELIRSIFGRYRIPCFVDKKYKLTDSLCYKILFSALETAEYNLRRDKLLDFAKNPLCGLTYDEADNLENYVLAHSINYRGFLSPFEEEESENERRKNHRHIDRNQYRDPNRRNVQQDMPQTDGKRWPEETTGRREQPFGRCRHSCKQYAGIRRSFVVVGRNRNADRNRNVFFWRMQEYPCRLCGG
jgi:ATP-dependent helicase/DNAse subunit B